jgi:hypothetical protein
MFLQQLRAGLPYRVSKGRCHGFSVNPYYATHFDFPVV